MTEPTRADVDKVLKALSPKKQLNIIKTKNTIYTSPPSSPSHSHNGSTTPTNTNKRASTRSSTGSTTTTDTDPPLANMTPASLTAELASVREEFSKLRFAYREQLAKETFLNSITSPEPQMVDHAENVALEAELVDLKKDLSESKRDAAEQIRRLEHRARELSGRFEKVQQAKRRLREVPERIGVLEGEVERLREGLPVLGEEANPKMNLPLPATRGCLDTAQAELAELEAQIERLEQGRSRKEAELEREKAELKPLEVKRDGAVVAAREARRRKEESERGGLGDELEMKGRWYRGLVQHWRRFLGLKDERFGREM